MVDTDSKILTSDQRLTLQRTYLWSKIHGRTPLVSDATLETDGRRRSRVMKEAVSAGLLSPAGKDQWHGNSFEVTPEVMSTLNPQLPDLLSTWSRLLDKNPHREAYSRPWIRLEDLSIEEQFGLIESPSVDWFVISSVPYEYHAHFADNPETVIPDVPERQAYNRYFAGPFTTLTEATTHTTGKHSVGLAVSSADLRATVADKFAEDKLQRTFATNLLWGLVSLDIVPKDVVFGPDEKPTVDPQLVDGHSLRLSTDVNPPLSRSDVKWEGNVAESIDRIKARIDRLETTLSKLRHIDRNVQNFGGWEKFMDALEERIRGANGG